MKWESMIGPRFAIHQMDFRTPVYFRGYHLPLYRVQPIVSAPLVTDLKPT